MKNISFRDVFAGKKRTSLGRANAKAGEIVVAFSIHARHLGRLSADQRSARLATAFRNPAHHARGNIDIELPAREIVEEEKRLCPLNRHVVRAHRDKIDTDRVVKAGLDGKLEFCAHAVIRRNEDGVAETGLLQVEEPPEPAQRGRGSRAGCCLRERLDSLDKRLARVDVHACRRIGAVQFSSHATCRETIVSRPAKTCGVSAHDLKRGYHLARILRKRHRPDERGVQSMATTDAAKTFAGAMAAALVLVTPAFAQQKLPSLFTVANVSAAAEAVNAVEAKKLATQSAETHAFRLLISRLADYRSAPRIPDLPPEQIERLVSDIDVHGEGVSGTSYVATFGVTFSERAIVGLLRQHGVTPIVDRGPEILIVPVFVEDGTAKTTDRNPWRNALAGLDLAHTHVPAKLAPTRGDLTAAIAKAYFANPASGLETLKSQYKTPRILVALAELDGGDSLTVKLVGSDALGLFSLQRKVKARDGIDEAALQSAARLAFETIQERWKLTHGSPAVVTAAARSHDSDEATPVGELVPVQATAEFSGLKEWQAIRTRLQNVPGVQHWDLRSVNPRSAEIGFDFPGGPERLAEMAGAHGLSVENGPDGLVIKGR